MTTDFYVQLNYDQYKFLEEQLRNYPLLESTHESMDKRFYHKAYRLQAGEVIFEFLGPSVPEPKT